MDTSEVISTMPLLSGITTILHSYCDTRLLLVQGSSMVFLAPALVVINSVEFQSIYKFSHTMGELQGATMVGSIFQSLVGFNELMSGAVQLRTIFLIFLSFLEKIGGLLASIPQTVATSMLCFSQVLLVAFCLTTFPNNPMRPRLLISKAVDMTGGVRQGHSKQACMLATLPAQILMGKISDSFWFQDANKASCVEKYSC
ncbi:hypothetical protein Nepgr_016525 [Nepenthes gracilis]|uniref:Uncharacterized protein n=1 Tax=Nepenthes gracilis TaxID=150966 RepID=A0AAD3XS71_NEPGR|nr:hypothetical protein Nepgr_016525 [Nepenthes gracilis]